MTIKNPYVNDPDLGEAIIRKILEQNPHLHRGDSMTGPVGIVDHDGNLSDGYSCCKTITATSLKVKLPLTESAKFNLPKTKKFIHFYQCLVMTVDCKVGDTIVVADPTTFEPKTAVVTQEMIDASNYALFRFDLS